MKIRTDTILPPHEKFARDYQRQNRIDAILYWVGIAGLTLSLLVIISLFIGLGNLAGVVSQIGGAL